MKTDTPARTHVIAVLVALTAALIARAVLQVEFREAGIQRQFAADLSYLVVPPILVLLLFPVLNASRNPLRERFSTSHVDGRILFSAVALGALLRLAWWCHVVVGVSLGLYRNNDPNLVNGLTFGFQCPPGYVLATGVLVMTLLVPITEEIVHRGLVQTYLHRFGARIAISGSAATFAVFHPPGTWAFVFVAGVVFGTQYWLTRSLWPSIVTHATINGLILMDWRCLHGQWNPPASDLPYTAAAAMAAILLAICGWLIIVLLNKMHRGEASPR